MLSNANANGIGTKLFKGDSKPALFARCVIFILSWRIGERIFCESRLVFLLELKVTMISYELFRCNN